MRAIKPGISNMKEKRGDENGDPAAAAAAALTLHIVVQRLECVTKAWNLEEVAGDCNDPSKLFQTVILSEFVSNGQDGPHLPYIYPNAPSSSEFSFSKIT